MFDDFDLGPQCEEFYDVEYWESIMNEESEEEE